MQLEYVLDHDPNILTDEGPGIRLSYTPLHNVDELWLVAATPPETAVIDNHIFHLGGGPNGEMVFGYRLVDALGGQEYSENIIYMTDITDTSSNIHPAIPIALAFIMLILAGGAFWYFKKNSSKK
jgi:hypothetical protein